MKQYDLVIVGAGSANMLPDETMADWRIAIVESDRFGGTCLNRGCIPSKMLVHTADVAHTVANADRFGVHAELLGVHWPAIRDRIFNRIDPFHQRGVDHRRNNGIDVYLDEAHFIAPKVLAVGDEELHADRFVIAAGTRPRVPDIPGLDEVDFHTSDTIMRVDELPRSMIVLGGGFIAAEMSHVFGSLGTAMTIVQRSPDLLMAQDTDIRRRFTDLFAKRFDLRLGATTTRVLRTATGIAVELTRNGHDERVEADVLLVATGRVPNSDILDVAAGGLDVDEHGHVATDDGYATSVPGVWAFGDLANHFQLKHMANAEARIVRHNLSHPDQPRVGRFDIVPSTVFADPQVATVGPTERQLAAEGRSYLVARRDYSDTAYGWALEDTTSFAKVLVDPATRLLIAAHIIGPHASMLIQPLVQAMFLGNTVDEVATQVIYTHPALTEVVEQTLLALPPPPG